MSYSELGKFSVLCRLLSTIWWKIIYWRGLDTKKVPLEDREIENLLTDERLITYGLMKEGRSLGHSVTAGATVDEQRDAVGDEGHHADPVVPPVEGA